ncbi:hypothetical protein GQ53DRAFT_523349 [Thozetella sp. PMI_491]|nr:hypothetical protein GQ53DRAFT_523349 [Thozetella sp. PMI_491]
MYILLGLSTQAAHVLPRKPDLPSTKLRNRKAAWQFVGILISLVFLSLRRQGPSGPRVVSPAKPPETPVRTSCQKVRERKRKKLVSSGLCGGGLEPSSPRAGPRLDLDNPAPKTGTNCAPFLGLL